MKLVFFSVQQFCQKCLVNHVLHMLMYNVGASVCVVVEHQVRTRLGQGLGFTSH